MKIERKEYRLGYLDKAHCTQSPMQQLEMWIEEAANNDLREPNAMALATTSKGVPSIRTILCKEIDEKGLIFYTSYRSHKAFDIEENPRVSALFYWAPLERQVVIDGMADRCDQKRAQAYFRERPRNTQLAAWLTEASGERVENRDEIDRRHAEIEERFRGREVECPPFWGGYWLIPHKVEFWQGREKRLHDRLVFTRDGERWSLERIL